MIRGREFLLIEIHDGGEEEELWSTNESLL